MVCALTSKILEINVSLLRYATVEFSCEIFGFVIEPLVYKTVGLHKDIILENLPRTYQIKHQRMFSVLLSQFFEGILQVFTHKTSGTAL